MIQIGPFSGSPTKVIQLVRDAQPADDPRVRAVKELLFLELASEHKATVVSVLVEMDDHKDRDGKPTVVPTWGLKIEVRGTGFGSTTAEPPPEPPAAPAKKSRR